MKKLVLIFVMLMGFSFTANAQVDQGDSLWIFGKNLLDSLFPLVEITDEAEIQYGDQIAEEFDATVTLSNTGLDKVKKIGEKIAKFVSRKSITYKFRVLQTDEINAYSMAGGNIWVTSGLLNYVDNDDELAFVIAHEIAHEDKLHNKKRITPIYYSTLMFGPDASQLVMIANNLFTMPFSKYQEYESDETGLYLMKKAGYDGKYSVTFFEKLALLDEEGEKGLGYIFRTHPYPSDRIKNLKSKMK